MDAWRARFERGAVVAGLLSGTSADGIDVALARLVAEDGELRPPELLAFDTLPFAGDLEPRVRSVLDGKALDLRGTALLARDLGRAFGRAARESAQRAGLALDLVASHGQTVWHHDGVEPTGPATLQLGDGCCVAEEAGCACAGDFRQRDVAAGGEGAPIAALADGLLFARQPRPCAVLNLGGIANLTLLDHEDEPLSFDAGPAGALLDGLARHLLHRPYDEDGAAAARGRPDAALTELLLAHPFFRRAPPKSTGRDTFGEAWLSSLLVRTRAGPEDLLATGVDLVARSVASALERFVPERPERLLVAGGGAHNATLLRAIATATGVPTLTTADVGVDPDAREALAFAVLGARCVLGQPSTSPRATGAREGRVLGKISL
jgi:anhydro-N-acetylmuramic acid kinase